MRSRRDLLSAFGIGSVVVPVIGSTIDHTKAAQIIEPPRVKPVELFTSIPKEISASEVKSVSIVLECADGSRRQIEVMPLHAWGSIGPFPAIELRFINSGVSPTDVSGEIISRY